MVTIKEILDFTETFAPVETAMDFDNSGLLVGDLNTKVTKVLISLDITNTVIKEAENMGAQLIISHHPVIFNPIKSLDSSSPVYALAQKNISALCLHTNLDLAQDGGVNFHLAKALHLENIKFVDDIPLAYGDLPKTMTDKEFAKHVKEKLNCKGVRYTTGKNKIKTVLVSSGAGGESIFNCNSLNAEGFVTGEIKHHEVLYGAENNITIVDANHFKTENIIIKPLANRLKAKFNNISFNTSVKNTDTINYI